MSKYIVSDTKFNPLDEYVAMNPTFGLPQSNLQMEIGPTKGTTVGGIVTGVTDSLATNNPSVHDLGFSMFTSATVIISSANVAAFNTQTGLSVTASTATVPTPKRGDVHVWFDATNSRFVRATYAGMI